MNTSYINWCEIILCLLLCCCVKCRPNIKATKQCASHVDCPHDIEDLMHPSDRLSRNKRTKANIQTIKNDFYDETSSVFWQKRAQHVLRNHLTKEHNENVAKNVIFFLGDGMSIPTLTAARIYLGQTHGANGEDYRLSFENFPYVGLSKTYCIDKQVPDSACTATAYLCGVKGNFQTIGVNGRVQVNDCKAAQNHTNQVHSLLALAQHVGKSTGIVTTTTVTHASPAGAYAHSSSRRFECDADVIEAGQNPSVCEDIASQLIHNKPGKKVNVIFGGGRTKFLPKSMTDADGNEGERDDGQNLIGEWKKDKKNAKYIVDRDELNNLRIEDIDYVLGLFSPYHMDYNLEADHSKQPNLVEMTEAAIKILQKEDNGYFLFVEGGRIDHGHHSAQAIKALDETIEFSNAIKRAVEMTNRDDTLIIVTSDHAHTMSMSGYPDRGNPIAGLNSQLNEIDDLPTITLSYANGPGYGTILNEDGTRKNLTGTIFDSNFTFPGTFPGRQESHGGDDVAVFALGCMSHLFSGVYEQSTIPHLVSYASCLGDGLTACNLFD